MPRLTHIVFDLDGTLTDPKEGILGCARYAFERMGLPQPEGDLDWMIGPPLWRSFARLLESDDPERAQVAVDFYRERYSTLGKFENMVYEGIPEALGALRDAGYRLYVATSKAEPYALEIMAHFGLAGYFDAIHGSMMDGTRVDKDELLNYVLDREAIPSGAGAMVGDRSFDMVGAKTHGLLAVGVLWGYGPREELTESGADLLVGRPGDLVAAIQALG